MLPMRKSLSLSRSAPSFPEAIPPSPNITITSHIPPIRRHATIPSDQGRGGYGAPSQDDDDYEPARRPRAGRD